ncbi:MAG: hypothetical protein A2751_01735 [Candidatus Doudnabacteria bacterium RIFCSPHIGHO2_01_FULL_46_14]|uniref:DUF86 domain-containing protein n=1 Tax=Candidatus Doudnabacteria bacterium RIFCSPHIGHO2_01_FULL_46_14 TaxID=1817824 RepID=A0A1F5NJ91_9BACT|nr:MAG: hypothetical protein A2751_01735 [Candidatus Doudnabacteria bacterium RIFCSPHIGHO2_01_FULL_46_14]
MGKDNLYKSHILESINDIESFTANLDYEKFLTDKLHRLAIIRSLEIIGEAANKLSDDFLKRYPSIPWHDVVGLRNRVIHEYFRINNRAVWQVIKHDLPKLEAALQSKTPLS